MSSQTARPATKGGKADQLPHLRDPADESDVLWQALKAGFRWYDRQAGRNRVAYQALKILALLAGALTTVLAATGAPPALTAAVAASIVVAEGVQQVFRFHLNWIAYRSAAERFREHATLYAAGVAPYADSGNRREILAGVLRETASQENAAWADTMRRPAVADQSKEP